tara:strand:+ start:487 stop:615 length:129 start_codon:yes stop_codon:yes gene_type:complete
MFLQHTSILLVFLSIILDLINVVYQAIPLHMIPAFAIENNTK